MQQIDHETRNLFELGCDEELDLHARQLTVWREHQRSCERCSRVVVKTPATLWEVCPVGAKPLRDHLLRLGRRELKRRRQAEVAARAAAYSARVSR